MTANDELRKVRVKKKKRLGFNWFFWISFVVILVPVLYFGYLLWEAAKVTHVPIIGDRIKNTVTYEIDDNTVAQIDSLIKTQEGVESVQTNLIVETLRITVNAADGRTAEDYEELAKKIYDIVDSVTPVDRYFTRTEEFKQYDLEINIYDNLDAETPIQITLTKNSSMEEYVITDLSTPLNEELAWQLTHPEEAAQQDDDEQTDEDINGNQEDDGQN
ncbi:MAG: hypothetical protein IJM79_08890 [Erysipelotrichaceae bacterium]|nr:hypothetical protein [Erysipelotrichaceae bacterium]